MYHTTDAHPQYDIPTVGYGHGHPLRVPFKLRLRRGEGTSQITTLWQPDKADETLQSNYFKGSILMLTYLVIIVGYYVAGFSAKMDMGVDRFDTLALGTQNSKTIGRSKSGRAY